MSRAIIFANGELSNLNAARQIIRPDDVLIAADGGALHARAMGLIPAVVIGDLDSLSEQDVAGFERDGAQILRFPAQKDETDLELALFHARAAGHYEIVIIGALGGRLDQTLGNLFLLTDPAFSDRSISLDDGVTHARVVTRRVEFHGQPGDTVSLVPLGSRVEGISTFGLAYPLENGTLLPYRTRGISNVMLGDVAYITVQNGSLICIHQRTQNLKEIE